MFLLYWFRIDITDNDGYQFRVDDGYIYVTYPNDGEHPMADNNGVPVRFLVEGENVRIVTDPSIQGDGSYGNPIGVDFAYRTGQYEPADFFVDLTCPEASLEDVSGISYSHGVVTKENVSRFGALYTFDEAKKIDAALKAEGRGWRLPTREDWGRMLNWAEEKDEDRNHDTNRSGNFGCVAGARLKAINFWEGKPNRDDLGMAVYPVGVCPEADNTKDPDSDYGFTGLYRATTFWSSTETPDGGEAYVRTFSYGHDDVGQFTEQPKKRFSIRLVRDIADDFDFADYAEILGDYIPVAITTDGRQLWTSINISVVGYTDYDPRGVTVPKAWEDVSSNIEAFRYYKKVDDAWEEIEDIYDLEHGLPSYANPVEYEELPDPAECEDEYVKIPFIIFFDMLTEAKFFYNSWDGNHWHKRMMREGESVVILYEDYPNLCDTAATPYVTRSNRNREWRIFTDEQTGLDKLVDTVEAFRESDDSGLREIYEAISGLTDNLAALSGFVESAYDEMQSGFTSAFTAIDDLQEEVDAIEEGTGLAEDGSYIIPRESGLTSGSTSIADAIGILDDIILENIASTGGLIEELSDKIDELSGTVGTLEDKVDGLQEEVDTIENGVGLAEDGSHIPSVGRFTSSAETIEGEILALDEVLGTVYDDVEVLKEKTIEAKDTSVVVETEGNRTLIGVNIDPDETHLKVGENGIWFDGDFGLI